MKRHNRAGKFLYFIGIFLSAFGIAFELVVEPPEPFSIIAIPLIIIGVILLIASNFYKESKDKYDKGKRKRK